jgi:hypothetical protein
MNDFLSTIYDTGSMIGNDNVDKILPCDVTPLSSQNSLIAKTPSADYYNDIFNDSFSSQRSDCTSVNALLSLQSGFYTNFYSFDKASMSENKKRGLNSLELINSSILSPITPAPTPLPQSYVVAPSQHPTSTQSSTIDESFSSSNLLWNQLSKIGFNSPYADSLIAEPIASNPCSPRRMRKCIKSTTDCGRMESGDDHVPDNPVIG